MRNEEDMSFQSTVPRSVSVLVELVVMGDGVVVG